MKNCFLFLLLLFLFACNDDTEISTDIPSCIQSLADEDTGNYPFYRLQMQVIGNQPHYWLNTGASALDGTEYIVNSNCDTVCHFCGFCVQPDCFDDYNQDNWEIIWEQ